MNLIHLTSSTPLSSSNSPSVSSILLNALSTSPTSERYYKGSDDIYIVLLWIAIWTFFRESMIRFVCGPIGRRGGIKKTAALQRFGEQGYDVVSHLLAVVFGACIMQNQQSGYRNLNMDGLWIGYPHFKLAANLKAYYLIQMGFWLQQILTLHLEKRRKDYGQMFLHHIITVSLLYLSYAYNFTYIGNVILVLMDVSDIVLGTAKMLKYLKFHENICNIAFGLFMLSWIVTRHYLYPKVLLSILYDSEKLMGRYTWDPENEWFSSRNVITGFITLLCLLQVLLILWFFMILRVAVGVLCGKPAGDLRSDDEG
ncbi:longevity assurance proteins LAG1/LAC1 [Cystobasidium minutum MCA 4210]|uniref:longevity assurance proteins LAG1/LAC1 n=1 Tax=Cystobasidium minutum MCA 4210 TaxID=1397322 RepID=UPI0034CF4766|eukprot:jgi/Rhomi1/146608/e_gw1.6.625.1